MDLNVSKKRRTKENMSAWERLKQQRLAAYQPIYSPKTVSPLFLLFGILLIPLGVVVYTFSKNLQVIKVNYTDCVNSLGTKCSEVITSGNRDQSCSCVIPFPIQEPFEGKIRLYYELTNFYQNHREYVESRDDKQMFGNIGTFNQLVEPASECHPFAKDKNGKIYFPCGAIANSMFNDTIQIFYHKGLEKSPVDLIRTGIAWESDKKYKFKNPPQFSNQNDSIWKDFVQPRDWGRTLWDLDPENATNNGLQNEDFIVWMRVSALPTFRKLHRIVNSTSLGLDEEQGMPAGNYSFEINYSYEVKSFDGTKSLILTENAFFGGQHDTLGIMLMSGGSLTFVLGLIFLLLSFHKRKTWNRRSSSVRNYGSQKTTEVTRPKVA